MGSHAMALGITAVAYRYTRRHAADEKFTFGTGKINSLAAFASAVLLIVFALVMVGESLHRLIKPVATGFNQAILVAIIGLAVNGISLLVLRGRDHGHDHTHTHYHDHPHENGAGEKDRGHAGLKAGAKQDLEKDHNLWSAYLHVMADALTSFLAVFALLVGKYFGLNWLDPIIGVVGAALVTHWSLGLLRSSGRVLLDIRAPARIRERRVRAIETDSQDKVVDLHVWSVGPEIYAVEIAVLTAEPRSQECYHNLLPREKWLVHASLSVKGCLRVELPWAGDDRPVFDFSAGVSCCISRPWPGMRVFCCTLMLPRQFKFIR